MDASPEVLAENVRAKRSAIDNDLELLRVRLQKADPRQLDFRRWAGTVLPILAGTGAVWWWARRRRSVRSLEQLLVHELSDLYAVEQQLVPALQRLRARAHHPELQQAFDQHQRETEGHIDRLERVFRSIGAKPRKGASDSISGIVEEGQRLLKRNVNPEIRDAWLIATAQRAEHVEIAGYGTARTFAETLGYLPAADLLQQTLEEERAADEKLTLLAERYVNPQSVRTPRSA
ncbi:MAG TPA: ferritin-like domain-containing protein [Vicinamibacterales bacterium]|nr:ferritin-like domain-containing protein [Vicinamibacterales bacterium]